MTVHSEDTTQHTLSIHDFHSRRITLQRRCYQRRECNFRRRRKLSNYVTNISFPALFCTRAALILSCVTSITLALQAYSIQRHPQSPTKSFSSVWARPSTWGQSASSTSRIAFSLLYSSPGGSEATNNGEFENEEEEWRAMISAFQMYKAAYGNLKVPLRFVVPSLAPWPG